MNPFNIARNVLVINDVKNIESLKMKILFFLGWGVEPSHPSSDSSSLPPVSLPPPPLTWPRHEYENFLYLAQSSVPLLPHCLSHSPSHSVSLSDTDFLWDYPFKHRMLLPPLPLSTVSHHLCSPLPPPPHPLLQKGNHCLLFIRLWITNQIIPEELC